MSVNALIAALDLTTDRAATDALIQRAWKEGTCFTPDVLRKVEQVRARQA